jgi:hypothetical protein
MHQKPLFLLWVPIVLLGATLLFKVNDPFRVQLLQFGGGGGGSVSPSCKVSISAKRNSAGTASNPAPENIDYSELCHLLAAQKFEEANFKTEELLLAIANLKPSGYLTAKDMKALPCEAFKTINQLWLEYSNHQFGFTVQQEIWSALGNRLDTEDPVEYDRFAQAVGWMDGSRTRLLTEEDFGFNAHQAKGHLPILPKAATLYAAAHLVSRAKACSL